MTDMKYRSLFIDLDDTLWDTDANMRQSLSELYEQHQMDKYFDSFEQFDQLYHPYNQNLWSKYHQGEIKKEYLMGERFRYPFSQVGREIDLIHAKQLNDEFMLNTTTKTKLVEGAKELLDYLAGNYKMYILSNGFEEVQYKKLSNSGLTDYFDKVLLSDQIGYNKPHPKIFDYALKSTNSKKKESIMIGDNFDTDITGAKNSNIDQIFFKNIGDYKIKFDPTYTVYSLQEIHQIL